MTAAAEGSTTTGPYLVANGTRIPFAIPLRLIRMIVAHPEAVHEKKKIGTEFVDDHYTLTLLGTVLHICLSDASNPYFSVERPGVWRFGGLAKTRAVLVHRDVDWIIPDDLWFYERVTGPEALLRDLTIFEALC